MDRIYKGQQLSISSHHHCPHHRLHHHHHHHPFTESIMKTLCFSLGLLLLVACCSCDMHAVRYSVGPAICCFRFATVGVPKHLVTGITKTHASCHTKAFIVKTKNRKICYEQSFPWANKIFQDTEGSGFKA